MAASRPLLLLAIPVALGARAGASAPLASSWILAALATTLLVLAVAASRPGFALTALAGAAFAIAGSAASAESTGYDRTPLRRWAAVNEQSQEPVLLRGVAAVDGRASADRFQILIDVDELRVRGRDENATGRARLDVGGSPSGADPVIIEGDRVEAWALLRAPHGFGTPGAFDAAAQARRDGTHAHGYVKSRRLVEKLGRAGVGWLRDAAARARQHVREALLRYVLPGPEQGLVRAMVLGDRTGVEPETAEAFRIAGTYHVLALSGTQVALVAGLVLWSMARLEVSPLASAVLASAALVFYAVFVGGDVPVTRATVTAVVMLAGRTLDLDADLANLLGLAAVALLVHHPSWIGDVGFQLSFGATLGLLLMARAFADRLPKLPWRLEQALAASLAAQAALVPLLLIHFHRLAIAALVLNLAAVPLSGAVLLAGFAVAAAAPGPAAVAERAGDLAWIFAHALLRSGELVRLAPLLDLRFPTPPSWAVALYLGGLLLLCAPGRFRAGATVAATGFLALVLASRPAPPDGRLSLVALDVGQGDCLAVRSPRGRLWMVDAGGSYDPRFDIGEAVVGPYLWGQGWRRLEALVLTHAHPDHVGGVPFLLRAFGPREVWEGPAPRHDRGYDELDAALQAGGAVRRSVCRGVDADWDGVRVSVAGPRPPRRRPWTTRNDDSVVLTLRWGKVTFLLTGDIEATGEDALGGVAAQVLKVPHHGSRSSSSARFLASVSPRVAVVSVGHANRFGHPHPEVVARYARAGVWLLRTDRDGTITVSTDGERIFVETARPPEP
ncbi:MAG: DNA internalization-related competence protein ComEC/Rec2 [Acidobacteria bacterium]|nr:MAG: DNA internalization-related competence protein ComEC/Rec2 [Acidobacteriota bacterium]